MGRHKTETAGGLTPAEDDVFGEVRKHAHSPDEHRRQENVVLAAVTDIVKERGLELTPTAYFAALMTSLDQRDVMGEPLLLATLYLLQLVFPRVPRAVLNSMFGDVAHVLLEVLERQGEVQNAAKRILQCFSTLVQVPDSATWTQSVVQKVFHALIVFTLDARPKVRNVAQTALRTFASVEEDDEQPRQQLPPQAAQAISTFSQRTLGSASAKSCVDALHALGWLQYVLPMLPASHLLPVVETILHLSSLGNVQLTVLAYHTMQRIFQHVRHPFAAQPLRRAVDALLEQRPRRFIPDTASAYAGVLRAALVELHRLDPQEIGERLPRAIQALFPQLHMDHRSESVAHTSQAIKEILEECLDEEVVMRAGQLAAAGHLSAHATPVHGVVAVVENSLSLKYQKAWAVVLMVAATMAKALGRYALPLCTDLLRSVDGLRGTSQFHCRDEAASMFGAFVAAAGPEAFLRVLPLDLEVQGDSTFAHARMWILPILEAHVSDAPLGYFVHEFLPLTHRLAERVGVAASQALDVEAKNIRHVYMQVWALLPAFCRNATDISTSFRHVARVLGETLSNEEPLRVGICHALQNLLQSALNKKDTSDEDATTLGAFAKNFLPILFNVHAIAPPDIRSVVIETISAFILVTPRSLVDNFFRTIVQKLLETTTSATVTKQSPADTTHALADLAMAVVAGLGEENLALLWRVIRPQLRDPDGVLQKKSYKTLLRIANVHRDWINTHLDDVREALTSAMDACSASARRSRLCVWEQILELGSPLDPEVLGEILTSLKEPSAKTRAAAYDLLLSLARQKMTEHGEMGLREMLGMLLAGLAGQTPHMISATVHALARLMFEFRGLESGTVTQILTTILLLFKSRNKEVIKGAFGFVKVVVGIVAPELLCDHLEAIVPAIVGWSWESKNRFRMKAKVILERLIRKVGFERIAAATPAEHLKFVVNTKRSHERAIHKKREGRSGGGVHAEDRGNKHDEYEELFFGGEDEHGVDMEESLDLLSSGRRHVPGGPKRKIRHPLTREDERDGVQVQEDGRLVVADTEEEMDETQKNVAEVQKHSKWLHQMRQSEGKKGQRKRAAPDAGEQSDEEMKDAGDKNDAPADVTKSRKKHWEAPGKQSAKRRRVQEEDYGAGTYRAKKPGARGDVKKKGLPDPYAYIPLESKFLNKRMKRESLSRFKNIVRGTPPKGARGRRGRQGSRR